ncbi:oxygen-dependent protoporphyrinogen oxidase [Actinoplanes lutulentus]|uniref:Coproporphyrinogen III oxidase n=1 Tax=Actinoplanes lutulentus TaxID=1287878 RepID=A0A327ZD50_9ACTN|nr:protoporphyrinogen oxidase [Actinoplanes lutulentus]MBB2942399.1 oxygen-dependent protoporphyrinogen oxidase [Actinoplanes lutulentus]RAK33169.1 oxygen-dependent protoporphyrinogen oxidase [Actinoplanes lutulentus]
MRKRIAVIGGGIAGLAAAVRLRDRLGEDADITVFEQAGVLGGKLRTGDLGGLAVERGAESFLNSGPGGTESAAVALARRLGLGEALVHPARQPAALAIGGRLTPIPAGTLVGVPGDLSTLDGVALPDAGSDSDTGKPLLAPGEDVAVGALVRSRYGDEVVDRLVDPMLGGVYAGRADQLSLRVTMPQLALAAETEHTLRDAVRSAQSSSRRVPGAPVFAAVDGGMSRLVSAAATASRARISLGLPVRELSRHGDGWRLVLGPVPAPQVEDVDAVVLAIPAAPAARLLAGLAPEAAQAVGGLAYASVALAGLALPPGTPLPELSGFLVPPGEGTLVKAATFFTRKWPHLDSPAGPVIVRASLGRAGEEDRLQLDDAALLARAHRELCALAGVELPAPAASWIQRWGGALPQYAPGHADRVALARSALPPGLALAGAAFDGVGIPVCVASGSSAADFVVTFLEEQ